MKLEELSKFAIAQNSPGSPRSPMKKEKRDSKKHFMELADKFKRPGSVNLARDYASELSAIRSVDELHIDYRRALNIKRGDLAIIQGEVFRCCPVATHLSDIPLILKRLDCVDRRTYDLKVYEADTFSRFQGHANIVSLYSYWSEKPSSPYTYKTLVLLMEEGILGDVLSTVVKNPVRPSNRLALRYLCDIAKGLIAVHNCNIIHGRIKPSSIYLDANNTAMIGEFGKVELDSARQTHQLFSKLLIGEAIPKTLVYWAPELLKLEKYGKQIDMWALGVTMYQVVTGEHPFNVEDENLFREDALHANFDMSRLEGFPRLAVIMQNLLRIEPEQRWTANQVLAYAQYDFALDIQRAWRGYVARKIYYYTRQAVILIQSHCKAFLMSRQYRRNRAERRTVGAINIQSSWRSHLTQKEYNRVKSVLMKCQANILCYQGRQFYLKFKDNIIICQAFARRYIARRWFRGVRATRLALDSELRTIQNLVFKYKEKAQDLVDRFPPGKFPAALAHLKSFEDFELASAEHSDLCSLPKLRNANSEIQRLTSQIDEFGSKVVEYEEEKAARESDDSSLRSELGVKYHEYQPMVEALKKSLKRVADACQRAVPLPIKIQHPYTYSKWDAVHEPYNVVENVLKDDDSVFRTLSPAIDLTLCNGSICFVSEVVVCPGECGPANLEVYTSNAVDKWTLVSTHKCTRDATQAFQLPGEQLCKYLRLKMVNNVRGGNIVSVRQVKIKGLVKD
eukprot:GFYU01004136.1.p1 GENE.GFYU01004136.1~~GFYU01004136.1.p1  ORF type:complete len:736 (-),score=254.85 GFYU01004136.1:493-2700(-)